MAPPYPLMTPLLKYVTAVDELTNQGNWMVELRTIRSRQETYQSLVRWGTDAGYHSMSSLPHGDVALTYRVFYLCLQFGLHVAE